MADSKTCDQCAKVRDTGRLWGWVTIQPLASNPHGSSTAELLGDFCSRECVAARLGVEMSEPRPKRSVVADAARVYRENIDGAPTEAVAAAFGWSRRTASRRVAEARELGLLPATTQGKKSA